MRLGICFITKLVNQQSAITYLPTFITTRNILSYIIMETVYLENYADLVNKIHILFEGVRPEDMRNLFFFLNEFNKEEIVPDDARVYISDMSVEGLEVTTQEKVSSAFIGGTKKYIDLKYPDRSIPPIVVLKGNIRTVIVFGEAYAIEAYMKSNVVRAIVIDIGDGDVFSVFNLDPNRAIFLIPLLQNEMEKSGIPIPGEGEET